ncbi:MAG TPA: hypothetical protein VLK23_16015 [Thermodesulfobacteriota bacterium]|nr:hypothetical protein [Thermodesulfobacteriota bacterium]
MIFHPLIIALYTASLLTSFMVLYSSCFGVQILRKWDLQSGSELQLSLERKTYLISTLLAYLFGSQLLSLFLYIFTADRLHAFFVGAMCAAGSLYVNSFGYPTLILKIINFLFAGLWLILNYVDNKGYDYPLIKKKYTFLIFSAPLILAEMILQANYFLGLKPDIITSCCGSLFSATGNGLASELSALPSIPMKIGFYISIFLTVVSGLYFYWRGRGGYLFSLTSGVTFVISILSILSFISLYFYELPTHNCPFCILQSEYGYVGYPLYLTLLGGTLSGMGVGILLPFRNAKSLSEVIPSVQRRLVLVSLISFLIFTAIVTARMVFSGFILEGY